MSRFPNQKILIWGKRFVSLLVVLGVSVAAWKSFQQLERQPLESGLFNVWWAIGAGCCYFFAMTTGWIYWHYVLTRMGQQPRFRKSFRAFYYSQLAKYVPGKALVVIVRTASVSDRNVRPEVAAISVFVETLTWLSVAAALALLLQVHPFGLFGLLSTDWVGSSWLWPALALFVVCTVITFPPILRRLVGIVTSRRFKSVRQCVAHGINFQTWGTGWLLFLLGWCCNATSLWMVLQAIPGANPLLADWPLCLMVVTLATTIGFLSFLPGGLGVRELVMIPLLGPAIGITSAIMASIALRLVWIATELLVGGIVWLQQYLGRDAKQIP